MFDKYKHHNKREFKEYKENADILRINHGHIIYYNKNKNSSFMSTTTES